MIKIEEKHHQVDNKQHLGKRGRDDASSSSTEEKHDSDPSSKRHKAAPKGFFDAQGGVALMLFDEDTGSDKVAWYVVPQDVFCAGIEPIAKKFGPLIGRSTDNMFQYMAEITEVFPYPPDEEPCFESEEEDDDGEDDDAEEEEEAEEDEDEDDCEDHQQDDDGDEKEEKDEAKDAVGVKGEDHNSTEHDSTEETDNSDKYCPDCHKKQESAALYKLIEHDWAKYIIPNTNPTLSLPLPACKVRIYNAVYTYSLAVNEHDDSDE